MPQHLSSTIAARLNHAEVAINNTLADAEIQNRVGEFGYPPAKMKEGRVVYLAAMAMMNEQTLAAGAQKATTGQTEAAKKAAERAFQALAKVARAVFIKNKAYLAMLGLTGQMPRTVAAFFIAADTLFDNTRANAEIKATLANYGYGDARLQREQAKIAAYSSIHFVQKAAKGAAQQASQEQLSAMNALNEWVAQYLKIAKVALHDNPKLLEKLGIAVRTTKTQAQRGAPAKAKATRLSKKKKPR